MPDTSYGIDLPYIPDDLLEALNRQYPERCPDIGDSDRSIWLKAGARQVVNYLLDQRRRQKEAALRNSGLDSLYMEEEGDVA